jgi:hypothetical protein
MAVGQVIIGFWVSLTVMVKLQFAGLPLASLTVQVTVVVPFGKADPLVGLHTGVPGLAQLSVTVGVG